MATLEDQLRAQWGGDWNISGVDRAQELARLLAGNGINNLSDIKWATGSTTGAMPQYGSAGRETWGDSGPPTTDVTYPTLTMNGLGWLGSVNNDNSLAGVGTSGDKPFSYDPGTGRYDLGWSAQGHGNVNYTAQLGPDGQYHLAPVWGSSSDMNDVRTAAKMALTAAGGAYGGDWVDAISGALGGAGAAEGAGSGIGTLGATEGGVTALGSSWSPASLGLTSGITPSISAAELASLSSALPGAVEVGAGVGAAAGGVGGGGSAPATSSIGGSGGLSSADKAALYGNGGYGPGMTGAQTSGYDTALNLTGSKGIADGVANSTLGSGLLNGVKGISDAVGGGQNLAGLIGAGIGATQGGGTETSSREPWAAAQPYLKNILEDAEKQRANLAANPFTPQQTQAYQNLYGGLDQARSSLPGLLNWGQQAMQRQSTTPSYEQLFGGQQPGGLLGQQPTAQAGGQGGLLGNDDRIKALMAKGRSLIG